jgi:hypothetical protein
VVRSFCHKRFKDNDIFGMLAAARMPVSIFCNPACTPHQAI